MFVQLLFDQVFLLKLLHQALVCVILEYALVLINSSALLTLGGQDLLHLLFNLLFLLPELFTKLLFAAENALELLDLVSPPIEVKVIPLGLVLLVALAPLGDLSLQPRIFILLFIHLASQESDLFKLLPADDLVLLRLQILGGLIFDFDLELLQRLFQQGVLLLEAL